MRGEEPGDVDEDVEDEGTGAAVPSPPVEPAPAQLAYAQRLESLRGRLQDALRAQHPESSKLRAVSSFAGEKEAAGDYAAATKALDMWASRRRWEKDSRPPARNVAEPAEVIEDLKKGQNGQARMAGLRVAVLRDVAAVAALVDLRPLGDGEVRHVPAQQADVGAEPAVLAVGENDETACVEGAVLDVDASEVVVERKVDQRPDLVHRQSRSAGRSNEPARAAEKVGYLACKGATAGFTMQMSAAI